MARVVYTGIVSDIIGSIGGLTFQSNRSGNIVRLRPSKSKRTSALQQTSIQSLIYFLKEWQSLTIEQQTEWNDYSLLYTKTNKFNQSKHLNGQNYFQSINSNLILVGQSLVDTPPAHTLPPSVATFYLSIQDNGIFIIFDASFNPANSGIIIWASSPLTSNASDLHSNLRLIKTFETGPWDIIDITSYYNNYFDLDTLYTDTDTIFYITVLIQTVEKTSGLASAGLVSTFKFNSYQQGVGYWIINRDFVIS